MQQLRSTTERLAGPYKSGGYLLRRIGAVSHPNGRFGYFELNPRQFLEKGHNGAG